MLVAPILRYDGVALIYDNKDRDLGLGTRALGIIIYILVRTRKAVFKAQLSAFAENSSYPTTTNGNNGPSA